ncbi:MAG: shikimate dehydrogenase [Hahellaceae bacterium]|nr:shikimate dehydrogenase [Hahellaceae bacterium]
MDQYAVVGNPIAHSKSPKIHALFAKETGQVMDYTAIQAPLDEFFGVVAAFFEHGGKGLNVTVPFKEQAWQIAERRSSAAEKAGAVNTLWRDNDGVLWGGNTDGPGLVRDITTNLNYSLKRKRILVLGAGGAVRGVLQPILETQPAAVIIANRTRRKADDLATLFAGQGPVEAVDFSELGGDFDVVINGTSASLEGDVPPISPDCVKGASLVYDMMYAPQGTAFLHWAEAQGAARGADGLGMLVEQAAEAFFIWRGVRPQTAPVLDALRSFTL